MPPSEPAWAESKRRVDVFMPRIKQIMGAFTIGEPTIFEDREQNTDLISRETRIAVRVRKHEDFAEYGDEFTVRAFRPKGSKTELEKIAEGYGDLMFYGFGDVARVQLTAYVVIDLAAFRKHLILRPVIGIDRPNHDGSSTLRAYPLSAFGRDVVLHRWVGAA